MRYNSNYLMYFCLVLGIFANIYVIIKITLGSSHILEYFQKNSNLSPKCEINVNNLLSFIENRHFLDLEQKNSQKSQPNYEKTLQLMLFAFPSGGLGNKLFEIISLHGIATSLQRKAVINATNPSFIETLNRNIQPLFPKLADQFTLRIIPDSLVTHQQTNWGRCCVYDDPSRFLNRSDQNLILDGHYFQSFKYFHHIRPQVREWLAPSKLQAMRAEILLPAKFRDDFLICTHVRRGDFQYDGLHRPSDATFTRAATDFLVDLYRKSHERVNVVVLGNDIHFAYTVFEDRVAHFTFLQKPVNNSYDYSLPQISPSYTAILTPTLTPEIDLAFSRLFCDVTLITAPSSTFGWWLSYLAKRTATTYYRDILESKDGVAGEMHPEDFYPPEWIKLKTDLNGKISKY
ncbi:Galactoside 2-alpha-L-fucosyltransferase [Caenorhabditis elegans]|uniref:Galactoside 2-alpha-L-fucosyltransferase n=1 Tax=Caenorhabditis elegans TaxID=6239 RepID=FUTB2_CAEEL|nr:Galactoside 2-alpha-L-fucosyltransferase [Caenorhabditis elegans]A5Z2X3.1 RecName: Full=Galactoside 2-alpha-L-fucosyltransferase; AltName: Full=Alpha-(1,2)-L-fucosyltransferase; AltName: Full=CE2FT-2 [Caenorhabditis elegans]CAN99658.1 Galactoside 2-alpha-L-fucosyltransferase [Caenorhabditis elegans]|eukprot:NP_001122446.1 Galactoside 2-alpha-L-fucosyltransferase [Caenorhabditis elegans]